MKREQLSDRIGNIEDRLVEQAENAPNFGRQQLNRTIRRIVSIAAVVAISMVSFAIGALAINKNPETIFVENTVYVEKEQEIIVFGNSGISLILPDWWEGRYEYEIYDSGVNADGKFINLVVYHTATRERLEYDAGILFGISFTDELRPLDYIWPSPGFTIAISESGAYVFGYPSDVQFDMDDPVSMAEFEKLSADIKNIEIVMSTELLTNTINMSNWVRGTVFFELLDENWRTVGSYVCDEEQSHIVKNIVESQAYNEGQVSFRADLRIMFNGEEYFMSSATGRIQNTIGEPRNATLSAEELKTINDIIGEIPSVPVQEDPLNVNDREVIWEYVQNFLKLITDGDKVELSRFLPTDGHGPDRDLAVAQWVMGNLYHDADTSSAQLTSIEPDGPEHYYRVTMTDANDYAFSVLVFYGEGRLEIDLSRFGIPWE